MHTLRALCKAPHPLNSDNAFLSVAVAFPAQVHFLFHFLFPAQVHFLWPSHGLIILCNSSLAALIDSCLYKKAGHLAVRRAQMLMLPSSAVKGQQRAAAITCKDWAICARTGTKENIALLKKRASKLQKCVPGDIRCQRLLAVALCR